MSWLRRSPKEPVAAAQGSLEIRKPRLRPSAAHDWEAGGYMTITNTGPEADRLLSAISPAFEIVLIHAVKVVGPGLEMKELPEGLVIPPEYATELRPRGYHLLLQKKKAPLVLGAPVPVTLRFEKAGDLAIELTTEAPGPVGEYVLHET
ncbi:hypothetical protein BH11PSE3_BH11PSE3_23210 [soil metagenome]